MEISKNISVRTFGRTRGKRLSARQRRLVDDLLPRLDPPAGGGRRAPASILEIGFGAGEHVMELARAHPDKTIIGAEPFINGVASLLSAMTDAGGAVRPEYGNIRVWPDDVRKLFAGGDFIFEKIFILHPDPWPKARHAKRRLLSAEFLKTVAAMLSKDGEIIIGTDHADHYDWILEQAGRTNLKIKSRDIAAIKTRYQKKNMFGSDKTMYLVLGG